LDGPKPKAWKRRDGVSLGASVADGMGCVHPATPAAAAAKAAADTRVLSTARMEHSIGLGVCVVPTPDDTAPHPPLALGCGAKCDCR
jgi:hypothetical protein